MSSHRRMRCSGCGQATNEYSQDQYKNDATTRICISCEENAKKQQQQGNNTTNNNQSSLSSSEVYAQVSPQRHQEEARSLRYLMQTAFSPTTERHTIFRRILAIKTLFPENRAIKHFDHDYFMSLTPAQQTDFLWIVNSGVRNPDSSVGCYAMHADDYTRFAPFFSKVVADYHKVPIDAKHKTDWSLVGVENLPENGILDLAELGLPPLSMRVRVGRNLSEFPLPGAMTREDRVNLEIKMCAAFDLLSKSPQFGGRYHSLTPGHPDEITPEEYDILVRSHLMFKDMSKDSFLVEAGIAQDWPYGRGCWISADRQNIVWCNEEDHLRIMSMKRGTVLNDVFNALRYILTAIESLPGLRFAAVPGMGYVTSCPSNLGTAMRASVHMQIPVLTADGTDTKAKQICKPLGLSVRGMGGEHTPIGKDGTVDISPSARYCITEGQIIANLYEGVRQLRIKEYEASIALLEEHTQHEQQQE